MTKELEEELTKLAFASCKECREFGYKPFIFERMIAENGGRQAIKRLILMKTPSDGFATLWEAGRLDLSAEALIIERPRFHVLFTDAQLKKARRRLEKFEYKLTNSPSPKKITMDIIQKIYFVASDVYKGRIELENGLWYLVKNANMNRSSAIIYIKFFLQLKKGDLYKSKMRANNIAIRYFLEKILADDGRDELRIALISLWKWIKYYERLPNASMIELEKVKKIHAEFSASQPPLIDGEKLEIDDELKTLIDSAPKQKTAPTFALGDDNHFHITLPPDNQPVNRQDVSLKKLRETIDVLLESFVGANAHQELTPVIEEYRRSISGDQISISQVYWSGIELDNAVQIIKQGIAAKEQPSLPFKTELKLKTALDAHGVYIMLDEEGRGLVAASAAYNQSAKKTEGLKQAIEKLSNTITESRNVLGADVREHVPNALKNMGQGQHPERSNQRLGNILTNFVSDILGWINRNSTQTIFDLVIKKVAEGVLGTGSITIEKVAIGGALLLVNIAPLLLIILAPLAGELTWVASVAHILERIRLMIDSKK